MLLNNKNYFKSSKSLGIDHCCHNRRGIWRGRGGGIVVNDYTFFLSSRMIKIHVLNAHNFVFKLQLNYSTK